ncbi:unnamed protein product [Rotaria sp. Silwood2]|nr:unnamed protein product [Rotaria sp. Silwood2]CAF3969303.1 unnamed protein product [Rotaria sp. Silwood2]CAF4053865.1 unnamed protein product [Rotaria sp. Silwood2]CAF4100936.1 unnamed protein product [Rotaria sp. Silwood2]
MIFINSIKAAIFYAMILISACFGFLFALTPAIPFILLNRRIYFRWCSFVMGYLLLMITCLLEDLLNIKIVVTGDDLTNDKKRSLIIVNHRTRLDWMYIWMLHGRYQILNQLKIILKAQLKHIPCLGWGCQHVGFLFLERAWTKDQQTMKNSMIDNVDDVTIGYEGNFPVTELDLLKGVLPKVVHFHVKRYSINDLSQKDEKIGQWLQNCWDEKENRLKEFYTKNQFDSPSKRFNNQQIESHIRFQRRLALILWILFILFWSYCLIAYIKIKLYVLIVCLFHVVIEAFANGIIDFVCQLDANYRQKHRAIKQD